MFNWYALYTKPRAEKKVDIRLKEKGIESYLPLQKYLRQWSDRKKWVEEPLFRGYVFVKIDYANRIYVLETEGVVRIVSFRGKPAIIPEWEMESIKLLMSSDYNQKVQLEKMNNIKIGELVKIKSGPLTGVIGEVEWVDSGHSLSIRCVEIGYRVVVKVGEMEFEKVKEMEDVNKG
jgi:transcription antitermination factor NusG